MRRDDKVAHAGIGGQDHVERHGLLLGAACLIEDVGDRLGRERAALVRLGDRCVEVRGAVLIEQSKQPGCRAAEMTAVTSNLPEEPDSGAAARNQAVSAAMLMRFTLGDSELFEMRRIPGGMRLLASKSPELVPWGWGLNGAFSVVGATLAVFIAMNWGFSATLLTATGVYALAAVTLQTR
jgi:hypothetical protein